MTTTGTSTGLVRMVNARDVITPSGVWALVMPGVQVVAPFVDLRTMGRYAGSWGISATEYWALPFLGRGVVAVL
ncbi:hypothetical protein KBI5_19790 [Frankia sp. KB5]|nr:hypothetical protein KBI5_19790 [Frankia sp. KB5]